MAGEVFFTEPRRVTVRGVELSIAPFPVRKLSAASRLAAPVIQAIAERGEGFSATDVVGLLQHADSLIELVALATDQPVEWVGSLNAAELVTVAGALIEENADFFSHSLLPALTAAMEGIGEKVGPIV